MRRLGLALLVLLGLCSGLVGWSSDAAAQGCGPSNPNCIVPTVTPCATDNRAASTAYVNACGGGGGGGVSQPFTTAPGTLTTNGQGTWGATSTGGLILGGQGSVNDFTLQNKTGAAVCFDATGTQTLTCNTMALTNPLSLASGGTGATTQAGALAAIMPGPTRVGDLLVWNGSVWADFAGNNTGVNCFQENASGVALWSACTGGISSISTGCGTTTTSGLPIVTTGTIAATEPVNPQTGVSYTILNSDCGTLTKFTNAAAIAVTLPQAGVSNSFVAGWYADYCDRGAGSATITPTTSTINGAATLVLATNVCARIVSDGTNYQTVSYGGGAAGTVTGSGASTDLAFWTSASNISGDAGFTYAGNAAATLALGTDTTNRNALTITGTWNNIATTGASGTGATATLTFAAQASAFPVGTAITVAGVTPAGYNGSFSVTASTTTSVSYANATTGAQTVAGTITTLFDAPVFVNITNTASRVGSSLVDVQIGGNSTFQIVTSQSSAVTNVTGPAIIIPGTSNPLGSGGYLFSSGRGWSDINGAVYSNANNYPTFFLGAFGEGLINAGNFPIGWTSQNALSGNTPDFGVGVDTHLYRDAAVSVVAIAGGHTAPSNASGLRVYNSTDNVGNNVAPTNYERAAFDWVTTSNTLTIGTQKNGTGLARQVALTTTRHISIGGGTPTANVCAGFALGTGSSDATGSVTYTSATTCSITFGSAYTNAPFCNITPGSAASTVEVVATTSGLTATFGTAQTAFSYQCFGT